MASWLTPRGRSGWAACVACAQLACAQLGCAPPDAPTAIAARQAGVVVGEPLTLRQLLPELLASGAIEHDAAFFDDGRAVLFSRRGGVWGEAAERSTIYLAERRVDGWSEPRPAPFSGRWSDGDVYLAPGGARAVFVSERPTPLGDARGRELWLVERHGTGWGEPYHLPPPVSSPGLEMGPALAADGTLYFASDRPGGLGSGDLYRAEPVDGRYLEIVNLGPGINGPGGEWNVAVAADESLLVFESSGRPGAHGPGGDLYLAYRRGDGWGPAIHLAAISTPGSDLMPRFSPEGSRLDFATTRTLDGRDADLVSVSLPALLARYPPPEERP